MVIDSPNRLITALYGGAHPEHMVELTPAEAIDLLDAAGFEIESIRGVFHCRDRQGALLPIDTLTDTPPHSIIDRCLSAVDAPDDSFIWWIHARRSDRSPDRVRVAAVVEAAWRTGWPERMSRLATQIGERKTTPDGACFESMVGQAGAVLYGPYAPVRAGRYRATIHVKLLSSCPPDTPVSFADAVFNTEAVVKALKHLKSDDLSLTEYSPTVLEFDIPETLFGFQMRLISNGAAALSVKAHVALELIS